MIIRAGILVVCWLAFMAAVFDVLPSLPNRVANWTAWSFVAGAGFALIVRWLWMRAGTTKSRPASRPEG